MRNNGTGAQLQTSKSCVGSQAATILQQSSTELREDITPKALGTK